MSTLDDRVERFLTSAVARLPDRATAALVLFIYAGLGLVLPLALNSPKTGLVLANVLATSLAALVTIVWVSVQVQASHRRHLVDWTTNLRLLTAREFEWLVGELFRREGWKVQETGRHDGPDGNIDLELIRDGQRAIVQCKRWQSWSVGVDEIRKFAGTLMREGLSGRSGTFVTLSDFSEQARTEAQKIGISLVDNYDLHKRVEGVRRTEPCDSCGSPMTLGRSPRGWWLRCVAHGCQGKRDLSDDSGRAVDLLTRSP